jgi:hypothetical protein
MWAWYLRSLAAYPLSTRSCTAAILAASADASAQLLERARGGGSPSRRAPLDWRRTTRLACWSLLVTPAIAGWFALLEARALSPLSRMLADQLLFAPASLAIFIVAQSHFDGAGRSPAAALRSAFLPILCANYVVWPAFQLANFALVPPHLQVLAVGLASFAWTVYLSLALAARAPSTEPPFGLGRALPPALPPGEIK